MTVSSSGQVAVRLRLDQALDEDLRGLLRRDLLPARDLPLGHRRDSRAAGIEPPRLVQVPVAVQVILPVDLESVLIVAPLIQLAIPVVVNEPAQQLPLSVA